MRKQFNMKLLTDIRVCGQMVKHTCHQAPGGGNNLAQPTNQWPPMWGPTHRLAGRRMPITKCYLPFTTHWNSDVSETRKVNLLLEESQYFTITLGSDLKAHFLHTIYFFTHIYIAIHHHRNLESVRFWKTTTFETGILSLLKKGRESS